MKTFYFLAFVVFLAGSSCKKSMDKKTDPNSMEVSLDDCETVLINSGQVEICYLSLLEDSRCPANANCVWQGVAKARFKLKVNGQESIFELSTLNLDPHYQTTVNTLGYKIKLLNIHPYPGLGGNEHKAEVSIQQQ